MTSGLPGKHVPNRQAARLPLDHMNSTTENNRKKSLVKYLIGIAACQILLLLTWLNLGADAEVTRYDSVRALLDSISAQPSTQNPELLLAASAIRSANRNVEMLSFVASPTSLLTLGLAVVATFRLRKCRITKDKDNPEHKQAGTEAEAASQKAKRAD